MGFQQIGFRFIVRHSRLGVVEADVRSTTGNQTRILWPALCLCAALALAYVIWAARALASEGQLPRIVNAQAKDMTEDGATIEVQIDPQGSDTTYELWLECQRPTPSSAACEPPTGGPHEQNGQIAADAGTKTITLEMTGLQPGFVYIYRVAASNVFGRVEEGFPLAFDTAPLGSCHSGSCPLESSISLAEYESARLIAEAVFAEAEATRQRQAREREERHAREQAAIFAAEVAALKQREEEAAAAMRPHVRCIVPSLKGDRVGTARRVLARAHCRLGKVRRPRRYRGVLRVARQGSERGTKLADGASVSVTLRVVRARRSTS